MKRLLFVPLLFWTSLAYGQVVLPGAGANRITESTVAELPPAPAAGSVRIVTDGSTAGDCAIGSGSDRVLCGWNSVSEAWEALGDGAGVGGGTIDGSGAASRVALWSDADTLTSDAGITYDAAANSVTATTFIGALTGNATTATSVSGSNTVGAAHIDETANYTWSGTTRISGSLESDAVSPSELTASVDDYAGCAGKMICRLTADGNYTITSIAGGGNWRHLEIWNVDTSETVTLEHSSASGTATNRILSGTEESIVLTTGERSSCVYDTTTTRWRCSPPVRAPLAAEADTLDTVFDRTNGNVISGATEAKPVLIEGDDPDYAVVLRVTSGNSPEVVGKCGGVVGGCDRTFSHNAGKRTVLVDSDGNEEVIYTEDVGFSKLTIAAEAQGDLLYRNASAWTVLAASTAGRVLQTNGAAANPSWVQPVKSVQVVVFDFATATSTGDGKFYFRVPASLNNYTLTGVSANVIAAGTTGTLNIDLARCAATTAGAICTGTGTSIADMLSTNLTIDSGENDTATAAAAAVINTSNDDVTTGQVIRIDIDAIHTTPATGLIVNMDFTAP